MQTLEIWRDVKDFEGYYQVSNLGRVKGLERKVNHPKGGLRTLKEAHLKACLNAYGYPVVILCKNGKNATRTVHQLVAESFLDYKQCGMKLVTNHINFNRQDNRVENLEIVTNRENTNQKHLKSSSKYVGVHWNNLAQKWKSSIRFNGKRKHLGYFINEIDAHNAYQKELKSLL